MAKLDIKEIARDFIVSGPVTAVFDPKVRGLCCASYPNHPKGCPKRGRHPDCPPHAPLFALVYEPVVRVIGVRFDFGTYIRRKGEMHPDWTRRALENPRHWQGHLRAELRRYAERLREWAIGDDEIVIWNPEAMGVDVTATCGRADVAIEWPPHRYVHEIALVGRRSGR